MTRSGPVVRHVWLGTAILLIAAFALIRHANDLSMWYDEVWTIFHSTGTLEQIVRDLAELEVYAAADSAFLAADLGLYREPREDHAAYIASWIEVLQNDKRAIVSAAAHAERAARIEALRPGNKDRLFDGLMAAGITHVLSLIHISEPTRPY